MSINLNIYLLYWYFQQNQCLIIKKNMRTQHTYISMGQYGREGPGQMSSVSMR